MKTNLELLESLGQLTTLLFVIGYLFQFYLKHRAYFDTILKPDCDKILKGLYQDLKNSKKSGANKSIRRAIKSKIRLWEFVKLTGYKWNKIRRDRFMGVYDMTQGSLTMKSVKFLFANSTVDEGIFKVKTSNMAKFDFICRLLFSIVMFFLAFLFAFLFYKTNTSFENKMALYLFFGIALISGIHNVITIRRERDFLKKMKMQYDGIHIG